MKTPFFRLSCLVWASGCSLGAQAWTVVVNSDQDSVSACATSGTGICTLRDALTYANANRSAGDANRIEFAIASGDQTIAIGGALPGLLAPQAPATQLTLDATTQPGHGSSSPLRPLITLRPSATPAGVAGLRLAGATTIKGLAIAGGFYTGVQIVGNNNAVLGCHVGVNALGTTAMGNQKNISVAGNGNRIGGLGNGERNIISAATADYGIDVISGTGNTIQGNYIGTDITGTSELGNVYTGIRVGGAGNNLIDSNLVSDNGPNAPLNAGVQIRSSGNTITRNRIGSNAAGMATLGAQGRGIDVSFSDANNNHIGTSAADGNLIVGSVDTALFVSGLSASAKSTGNRIIGNIIGANADASAVLPNKYGITLNDTASAVVRGNTIVGSVQSGITMQGDSSNTLIQGNFIGTNASAAVLPNRYGIAFFGTAHNNTVGGLTAQDGNVIANNHELWGVVLYSSGVYGTSILGNSIYRNTGGGIAATALANRAQTAPVLTALSANSITATLDSVAHASFRIEYFASPRLPDGFVDEAAGKRLLGSEIVLTDATGHAALSYSGTVPTGEGITATATRQSTGDSSRFSSVLLLNNAPQAIAQTLSTPQNTALSITLTGTDPDGDTLTYALVDAPAHGTLSGFDPSAGTLLYTPTADFSGSDAFTFTASNGSLTSTKASITIAVTAKAVGTAKPIPGLHNFAVLALSLVLPALARRRIQTQRRSAHTWQK